MINEKNYRDRKPSLEKHVNQFNTSDVLNKLFKKSYCNYFVTCELRCCSLLPTFKNIVNYIYSTTNNTHPHTQKHSNPTFYRNV